MAEMAVCPQVYLYTRWYNLQTAHFTQADMVVPNAGDAASYDRYTYVRNNPVRFSDPSGHKACNGESFENCGWISGSTIATENKIAALYDTYKINLIGINWNLKQATAVKTAFNRMDKGITRIAGDGQAWIKKHFGGTNIDIGNKLGKKISSSYVPTKNNVHLLENFENSNFLSINSSIENMIIHEFGHVFDNRMGTAVPPAVFRGGGPADQLIRFMGGMPSEPLRFAGGVTVPEKNKFGLDDGYGYGNNSSADYFAHSFTAAIVDPDNPNAPSLAVLWVSSVIYLTR
jgi:RHS repeat-associated protein